MSSARAVSFENRDRYIEIGLNIAYYRKKMGMNQEQLAEKACMSRSHLGAIEAPNIIRTFSLELLLDIANVLQIEPSKLLEHRA
ncbi:MAG: helix-turn-helix transcriptional regulator [Anaerotruncus sp.]|nr:helix-turn-helix transcriptional regulator [Anaerotruncus sp.]